jgi:hypothetical protein
MGMEDRGTSLCGHEAARVGLARGFTSRTYLSVCLSTVIYSRHLVGVPISLMLELQLELQSISRAIEFMHGYLQSGA